MEEKEKEINVECTCEENGDCHCHECDCENCDCGTNKDEEKKCNCEQCECEEDKVIDEIGLLTDKIKELEDKLLRNQAELMNYKRRKEEETERLLKYSNMDLIKEVLPVLDNFERAINMDDNDLTDEVSKFLEGFKMTYGEFRRILTDAEVIEIDALGKKFDPNIHQAVMTDSVEGKEPDIILEVLQKGYMLKDKVIRPAMVKVNK